MSANLIIASNLSLTFKIIFMSKKAKCQTGGNKGGNHYWYTNSVGKDGITKCSGCQKTIKITCRLHGYNADPTYTAITI